MHLFTRAFWRDAGIRAARTVLVALVPLVAPLVTATTEQIGQVAAGLAFAGLASILTSAVSLPEQGEGRSSRWVAIADRAIRSVVQVAAAAFGAAAIWSDIDWTTLGTQALAAGLLSVVLGLIRVLPEEPGVVEQVRARDGLDDDGGRP